MLAIRCPPHQHLSFPDSPLPPPSQAAEFAGQLASAASAAPAAASGEAGGEGEGVGSASEPLLALYTRMINAYNEAKGHVRNALKSSSGQALWGVGREGGEP